MKKKNVSQATSMKDELSASTLESLFCEIGWRTPLSLPLLLYMPLPSNVPHIHTHLHTQPLTKGESSHARTCTPTPIKVNIRWSPSNQFNLLFSCLKPISCIMRKAERLHHGVNEHNELGSRLQTLTAVAQVCREGGNTHIAETHTPTDRH